MNPHSYAYLIFDQDAKKHMMEKRQPLQQVAAGKSCLAAEN
jgi:hypothetical protein